ncbi:FAR1 DNA-binding domain [Sesbania bispinosa]|nr:FAR1 DNA-binding domain [Sesbania bispinosa]
MENSDFQSANNSDVETEPVIDFTTDDSVSEEDTKLTGCVSEEDIEQNEKDEKKESNAVDDQNKRMFELSVDDMLCKEFGSEEKAYDFYKLYAKYYGFVVRKDDVTKDIGGNIIMRQFVCNREGLRNKKRFMRVDQKREHRVVDLYTV